MYAVVSRSTFPSPHVKNTTCPDMFGPLFALISWDRLHFGASDLQFGEDEFVWQVQQFVWPGLTFRGRLHTLEIWTGRIAKRIGARSSALHSIFHCWRKSRRIGSFLMLPTSKVEEVSQHCFACDVIKVKSWGSLAELLCFWCCKVQKFWKSRRITSVSRLLIDMWQIDKQTRYIDRQIDRQLQLHYSYNYNFNDTSTKTTTPSTTITITQRYSYNYHYNCNITTSTTSTTVQQ